MKRLIIVLLITGAVITAEAQSMVRVHLTDNTPVNVAIDGRYFNKRGTGVTVGDLPPGRHRLQIYALNEGRRGRAYEDVIYEGKVKTSDGMITLFTYDPASGGIDIQQQEISAYQSNLPQGSNQGQYDERNGNSGNGAVSITPDRSRAGRGKMGTLTDAKIDMLKTQVAAKKTDTEKMKIAKDALNGEKMTTNQVGTMMDWFEFESDKADFAEWAFSNTVDNEYFSDLDAKFTYKNYQDDLDKFIQNAKSR